MIKTLHPQNEKTALDIRHSQRRHQKGAALVIVLAFVVLLTVLVVAYFSRTQSDNKLSNSSVNQSKSDELARSAADIILGDLRQEIASTSASFESTSGNTTIYSPKPTLVSGVNTYPTLVPVRNPMLSGTTPTPIPNLIRISGTTPITSPGVDHSASNALSTTASANSQSISLSRWNSHYLIPRKNTASNSVDSLPVDSFTAPSWVFVTNQGPQVLTSPVKTAVGRYAYAIYDEGGILDVNVAGYPSTLPANALHPSPDTYNLVQYGYGSKGALTFADLKQLPPLAALPSFEQTTVINNLVGWRNLASAQVTGVFGSFTFTTAGIATFYDAVVANKKTGLLKVSQTTVGGRTDQAFLSRQQLINLMVQGLGTSTNRAQLQNSLQYLGTFSRDINTPIWSPSTPTGSNIDYAALADTDTNTNYNRNFLSVRVTTPFIRPNGTNANTGELLLAKRFPLSRLALITSTSTADTTSDIFKYFGLTRATASSPWVYCNSNGTPATTIKSLKQVAAEAREPNFIELLKSCILTGSLGKSQSQTMANTAPADVIADHQLMRIAASIIDQYDTDNYPTTISYNSYKFFGIEDIPYPNEILTKFITSSPAASPAGPTNWYATFTPELYFEMWNPHQALPNRSSVGPTNFRITVNPQATYSIGTTGIAVNAATITDFFPSATVKFQVTTPASDYREPLVVRQDAATAAGDPSILSFPTTGTKALGFKLRGPAIPAANLQSTLRNSAWFYPYSLTNTMFSFQYQDASNTWQTYATGAGLEELYSTGFQPTGKWVYVNTSPWNSTNPTTAPRYSRADNIDGTSFVKSDPRTFRFGLSWGFSPTSGPTTADNPIISGTTYFYGAQNNPWGGNVNFRHDLMSQNAGATAPTGFYYTSYNDVDNVRRPGDCYLQGANWLPALSAKPPMQSGITETRPIILNRPFRTVGELGYVFRDIPWKTLDLFSPGSADLGLMDVFCVEEDVTVNAGRVSINTRNPEVLKTLLAGTTTQETAGTTLTATEATAIAQAITSASQTSPILNLGDLSSRLTGVTAAMPSTNKLEREAVLRALGGSTSSRTWNLLIDVVAQPGKFTPTASTLNDFNVEGSRRYWVHVAIDRYTGKVIDKQLERVDE